MFPYTRLLCYLVVFDLVIIPNCGLYLYKLKRYKRSDIISDFLADLDKAAQKIGKAIFGSNAGLNNFWTPNGHSQLPQRGQQQPMADFGSQNWRQYFSPNSNPQKQQQQQQTVFPSLKSLWFCDTHPKNCEHLQCLAENFQHSEQASNLKAGSIALTDVSLRQALIDDPKILQVACDKAKLDEFRCSQFKMLLDLANALDPVSEHAEDEPRDKRNAASHYYDYLYTVENGKKFKPEGATPRQRGAKVSGNKGRWPKDCDAILRPKG